MVRDTGTWISTRMGNLYLLATFRVQDIGQIISGKIFMPKVVERGVVPWIVQGVNYRGEGYPSVLTSWYTDGKR